MSKGPAPNPELIETVRRCAEAGMAHRNGIKFKAKKRVASPKPEKPVRVKMPKPAVTAVQPAGQSQLTGAGFGTMRALLKKPGPQCSWLHCKNAALQGDMFCYQHGRKGLL